MSEPAAPANGGSTNPAGPDNWRAPRQRAADDTALLLSTPSQQFVAQKFGLNAKRLAYHIEGKGAFATSSAQPFLGLKEQTLAPAAGRTGVILEATQSVFQNRHHQALDGSEFVVLLTPAIIELCRSHDFGNEQGA